MVVGALGFRDWLRMASLMASAAAKRSSSGVECRLTAMWVELEEGRGGVSAPAAGVLPDMMTAGCGGEWVLLQIFWSLRQTHSTGTPRPSGGCRIAVRCLRGVRAAGARLWARLGGRTEQIFKWSRGSGNSGPGKGQEMPLEAREGRAGWLLVCWVRAAHWPGPGSQASQAVPSSETRNNGLAWASTGRAWGLAWPGIHWR